MGTRASHSSESERDSGALPQSEIDAWADRERERRRQWLEGPTEEEKEEWARRERRRRREATGPHDNEPDDEFAEGRRVADRWSRDVAYALVGLASRLADSPYRLLDTLIRDGRELVREGRDWEDRYRAPGRRRPRVRLDDED